MRAHGICDESRYIDDDDPASDWEEKLGGNERMHGLRTNPNRLNCRVCENCGKEFFSLKDFLEHGKCSYRDVDQSLVSSEGDDVGYGGFTRRCSAGAGYCYKRKRTLRTEVAICPSSEEEDLANCLMMLSNATKVNVPFLNTEPEESSASIVPMDKAKDVVANKGMFECKACKKVFSSHQALGGHRASHKKVKGCFAARFDRRLADDEDQDEFFVRKSTPTFRLDHTLTASTSKKKSKVHECSICHRVFSSGQALGGHKRCHWITSNSPAENHTSSLVKLHQFQDHQRPNFIDDFEPLDLKLDLNLTVSTEIYLQQLQIDNNNNNDKIKNNNNYDGSKQNEEEKAESKVKLAKLSELKDVNMSGDSSPWLQVGIGSNP